MKCPLMPDKNYSGQLEQPLNIGDCIKGECAWWVKASESCAMEAIPRIIGYVGSELKTIKDKMPHEE